MKKKLNIPKIKVSQFFKHKNIGTIPRTILSSLLVIFFFYSVPIIINFAEDKNKEFQNNSKAILAYTLNNGEINENNNNKILNENDLLLDIFSLNDLETDTVRLDASTIKKLFEDTNYTLKDVRKKN